MQNIAHASEIDFFGFSHCWRTRRKFSLHFLCFGSHTSLPGSVNGHCQLMGVLQLRVPQVFATWTLDHTIFCQTHSVCSNNLLNTFIPSLSLELWCLVFVIIFFFVMFVAPSVDNHTTHASGAFMMSRLAQRVTASMDYVVGSIHWYDPNI